MKKKYLIALAVVAVLFFIFKGCGNGSSGSAMLDLDIRILPSSVTTETLDHASGYRNYNECKQYAEDFLDIFTVLPGPYEFTWEELKNTDGALGFEQCSTKLKIKLRLNKTLKINFGNEEKNIDKIKFIYTFEMFNSEGKTKGQLFDENDMDHATMLMDPDLLYIHGVDGKHGSKMNTDGLRDFYHFLTDKPGTELDLIVDCGVHPCRKIEDMMEYNKGLYINVIVPDVTMTRSYSGFQIE